MIRREKRALESEPSKQSTTASKALERMVPSRQNVKQKEEMKKLEGGKMMSDR